MLYPQMYIHMLYGRYATWPHDCIGQSSIYDNNAQLQLSVCWILDLIHISYCVFGDSLFNLSYSSLPSELLSTGTVMLFAEAAGGITS